MGKSVLQSTPSLREERRLKAYRAIRRQPLAFRRRLPLIRLALFAFSRGLTLISSHCRAEARFHCDAGLVLSASTSESSFPVRLIYIMQEETLIAPAITGCGRYDA